jgi:ribosomal protein S12 methylthiotransferase accessory factor
VDKVFFKGTHRVRHPEETLDIITPLFPDFGITRLADVTGLDVLGVPTVMAVRPLASTLAVSQGKGATLLLAKVSGAMEAIELWHAEHAVPPSVLAGSPAAELDLGYRLIDLERARENLVTEHSPVEWISAWTAVTGRETYVPRGAVQLGDYPRGDWPLELFSASSNGLASGNTRSEALIHALYEVIERDCISILARVPAADRTYIDPASVTDENCAEIIAGIQRAGGWLELVYVPSRWPVPCFVAYLWHEDFGHCLAEGSGAHTDPAIALSRAITEAAQSRLTFISGARDDIESELYRLPHSTFTAPHTPGSFVKWPQIAGTCQSYFPTDDAEVSWLAETVARQVGHEPMIVDLSSCEEFAVVKVICPGLRFDARHDVPREDVEANS